MSLNNSEFIYGRWEISLVLHQAYSGAIDSKLLTFSHPTALTFCPRPASEGSEGKEQTLKTHFSFVPRLRSVAKCLAWGCWGGFLSKMSKNWKLCELFISCFVEFLKKGVSLSHDLHCFCLFSQEASFLTVSWNSFFSSRVDFRSIWLLFCTPCCGSLPTQFCKKRPARRLCA